MRQLRNVPQPFDIRDNSGAPQLVGYASLFDMPYQVRDFLGSYQETVMRGAFASAITRSDVRLLQDHEGTPLARTKSGTLRISEDSRGLRVEADLDPASPRAQEVLSAIRRGDLDQMSFAFTVAPGGDDFHGNARTIREVEELFDVSVVTFPANAATKVSARSISELEALLAPAALSGGQSIKFAEMQLRLVSRRRFQ